MASRLSSLRRYFWFRFRLGFFLFLFFSFSLRGAFAVEDQSHGDALFWIKVKASNKFERTNIEELGGAIEKVADDHVFVIGDSKLLHDLRQRNLVLETSLLDGHQLDFPLNDSDFHNYKELTDSLSELAKSHPDLVELTSIGKTYENRDIWALRISTDLSTSHQKPAVVFMGGHHAREHLSVEVPLLLAQHLVKKFDEGDQRVGSLLRSREVHIIPLVNPDGAEYDVEDGSYKWWRKNRRDNGNRTWGVDLNRNYGYEWGTGGSSNRTSSDTYMGPSPFSEPETIAIRDYIEGRDNISILLSFHTFSQLILYPWGHKYDSISDYADREVHQRMAQTMAGWNGYTPQQSSELYIASGDTTDWSFGTQKIISFTFELDPGSLWGGGFYPGSQVISQVFQKNLEPCLYLLEYSDNPYRVLAPSLTSSLNVGHNQQRWPF